MINLFVALTIVFLLVLFVWRLKRHLMKDLKESELDEVMMEGDLLDIDKEILEEKVRQKSVSDSIDELKMEQQKGSEEDDK